MNAALMQADFAKLPLWFGNPGYPIEQWCKRVDQAAAMAGWQPDATISFVYNILRGPTLKW